MGKARLAQVPTTNTQTQTMKTNELSGTALDYAVNLIEECCDDPFQPMFSTSWAQGGPIIEREGIAIRKSFDDERNEWVANLWSENITIFEDGPTPLIAAMRCFVASKLGDEVSVPEELCEH